MEYLTGLSTGIWGYIAAAVVAAGLSGYAVHRWDASTIAEMKLADAQAANQALQDAVTHIKAQDQVTHDADVAYAQSQQKTITVTQETIRKVPIYVTKTDDARCTLNVGFVRLLDAAGLGVSPDTLPNRTAEPDSADSGIPLSQAAALLAQDLGDAAGLRSRLLNARDAWQAQAQTK